MTRELILEAFSEAVNAVTGAKTAGATFSNEDGVILSIMQALLQVKEAEIAKEEASRPNLSIVPPSIGRTV